MSYNTIYDINQDEVEFYGLLGCDESCNMDSNIHNYEKQNNIFNYSDHISSQNDSKYIEKYIINNDIKNMESLIEKYIEKTQS